MFCCFFSTQEFFLLINRKYISYVGLVEIYGTLAIGQVVSDLIKEIIFSPKNNDKMNLNNLVS